MLVKELYAYMDSIAPFSMQEPWDNSGLQVGDRNAKVHRVLLSLDATAELCEEAAKKQCDCILTHHPFLFKAQKQFTDRNPAFLAAKYGISVISAHTSYDSAKNGVQDILAKDLELQNVRVAEDGLLRIGTTEKQSVEAFAHFVAKKLSAQVAYSMPQKTIETVALCSGAGADLWEEAASLGADVFLTGEMKHHEVLDANAAGLATIAAGHFETEISAVRALKETLQKAFPEVEFLLSEAASPIHYTR